MKLRLTAQMCELKKANANPSKTGWEIFDDFISTLEKDLLSNEDNEGNTAMFGLEDDFYMLMSFVASEIEEYENR